MRDVAEALDISKGTILHHFGSKEAILEQINNDYMRRRLAEARDYLPQLDDPVDELQAFICQLMLAQQDDRAATVAFSREIVRSAQEETMAEVRKLRREFSALLVDILTRGVKSGAFADSRPPPHRPTDLRHGQLGLDLVPSRRPHGRRRDRPAVQPQNDRRHGPRRGPRRRRSRAPRRRGRAAMRAPSPRRRRDDRDAPTEVRASCGRAPNARRPDRSLRALRRDRSGSAGRFPVGRRQLRPEVVAAMVERGEDGGRDAGGDLDLAARSPSK